MSDKVRGTLAILVGFLALYQSYTRYQAHLKDWYLWPELIVGLVLIGLGVFLLIRKRPTAAIEDEVK